MGTKLGQEPAFPLPNGQSFHECYGMSKRFYAACSAMQGILSNQSYVVSGGTSDQYRMDLIKQSFEFADELLNQETQTPQ